MINEGDQIKVFLPGESCWATVFKKISETIVIAKIDNEIGIHVEEFAGVKPLHSYRYGDLVTFQFRDEPKCPGFKNWYLSPAWEQISTKPKLVDENVPPIEIS